MEEHPPHPHAEEPPRPPERALPPFQLLWRGVALGALSLALARAGAGVLGKHWALLPVGAALALGSVLAAWGSAIQLTGGTRHDDHPWV
jgi:hypothetical protein